MALMTRLVFLLAVMAAGLIGVVSCDSSNRSREWAGTVLDSAGIRPLRFAPMVWHSDAVYGRWLDELDRAYVVKLNLVPGVPGTGSECR